MLLLLKEEGEVVREREREREMIGNNWGERDWFCCTHDNMWGWLR